MAMGRRSLVTAGVLVVAFACVTGVAGFSNRPQFKTESHYHQLDLSKLEFYTFEDCPQYYQDRYGKYNGKDVDVILQSHSLLDESQSGANARAYLEDNPNSLIMKPQVARPPVDKNDENMLKNVPADVQEEIDDARAKQDEKDAAFEKEKEANEAKKEAKEAQDKKKVEPAAMDLTEKEAKMDEKALDSMNKELASDPFNGKKGNLKGSAPNPPNVAADAPPSVRDIPDMPGMDTVKEVADEVAMHPNVIASPDHTATPVSPTIKHDVNEKKVEAISVAQDAQREQLEDKKATTAKEELPADFEPPKTGADDTSKDADTMGPDDDMEPPPDKKKLRSPMVPSFVAPAVSDTIKTLLPPPESAHTCRAAKVLQQQHRKEVRASTGFREKMEVQCLYNRKEQMIAGVAFMIPVKSNLPSVQTTLFDELGTIDWDYGFIASQEVRCSGEYVCLDDFYKNKEVKAQEDHKPTDPTFNLINEIDNGPFCVANVRTDNQQLRKLYYIIPNHMDNRKVVFGADKAVDAEHI